MASDGQIVFEVTADGKHAIADIKDITRAIEKETKNWDNVAANSTANIGNSFTSMLKKVAAGFSAVKIGQELLKIGKESIQAASDLQEVQNVVDVTFGDGAAKIETWAKNAGKQFGLTETQAKRFTSTLGAMMKSAGMSGDQITDMSTDLAGLAADMASFYNLDFDTAFQKIRSGISGETEPLKQLGINMSVANLNAFALQQGLSKTFEQMTQGEQTMLRYQYLMQATADAQGDFARTSDGYANSMRALETNIESLKTTLGTVLLPVINNVVAGINEMMTKLTTRETTVLDDFAAIDLQTAEKIQKIDETAEKARTLTQVLNGIDGQITTVRTNAGTIMNDVPDGKTGNVSELVKSLGSIESAANKAKDAASGIDKGIKVGQDSNAETLNRTAYELEKRMSRASEKAGKIDSQFPKTDSNANKYGKDIENITTNAESATTEVEKIDKSFGHTNIADFDIKMAKIGTQTAVATAEAVSKIDEGVKTGEDSKLAGVKSDLEGITAEAGEAAKATAEITGEVESSVTYVDATNEQYELWLQTCKELTTTIPGLRSIINAETGEIKGGTEAVKAYIDEWERIQKLNVFTSAHQQKQSALAQREAALAPYELDMTVANYRLRNQYKKLQELHEKYAGSMLGFDENGKLQFDYSGVYGLSGEDINSIKEAVNEFNRLQSEADKATKSYTDQRDAIEEAKAALEDEAEMLKEQGAELDKQAQEAGKWSQAEIEAAQAAADAFIEASQKVRDYYENTRKATETQVNGVISGFNKMKTAASQYYESLKEGKEVDSVKSMTEALKSQLDYIQEYQANLKTAREAGVSDEILAQLSDGSEQSAMYLHAIAEAADDKDAIEELNKAWAEVEKGKSTFTDALTQQKLAVDEAYQGMVDAAQEAAAGLNVAAQAKASSGDTVSGIAQGITDHAPEVQDAVDNILSILNQLSGWGVNINLGTFGDIGISLGNLLDGSHETGLDRVPFDHYLAELHEGEGILTAEENRIWQRFKAGDASSRNVDYDKLGGVMRDNIHAGGNVYLDGTTVGKVVSQMQGNSYRNLQRSGWQA